MANGEVMDSRIPSVKASCDDSCRRMSIDFKFGLRVEGRFLPRCRADS